jgi:hypothetical protein
MAKKRKHSLGRRAWCVGLVALLPSPLATAAVGAQQAVVQGSAPAMDSGTRAAALDRFLSELDRAYVFPSVAKAVSGHLAKERRRLIAIQDPQQFAKAVHEAVRSVSKDVHLHFMYDPERHASLSAPPVTEDAAPVPKPPALRGNHGFQRVALLDGNIGLLELDLMANVTAESGARATAAMAFLGDADAILIDLRRNPGGSGQMNQLLSTYFFAEGDDKWLISNENRSRGTFVQEWTQPYVPGKRLPDTPLYFLVGKGTGSAAEGFAYNLQALGRAKVIGEPTAGGAHSGDFVTLPGGFVAFVPSGRTINPLTKSNWEGTGVKPDVAASSARAQEKALELIWRDRLQKAQASSPEGQWAAWQVAYYEAKAAPLPAPQEGSNYVGSYGDDRRVMMVGEALYYQRGKDPLNRLLPLKDGSFAVEGLDYYGPGSNRIRFVRNAQGAVTGFQQLVRHQPFAVATIDHERK